VYQRIQLQDEVVDSNKNSGTIIPELKGGGLMNSVLSISEAASLALHGMELLAVNERKMSVREMARLFGVSEAHLAKVFQRLARSGLVISTRGPGGGFYLARDPAGISLYDIYSSIEGEPVDGECILRNSSCPFGQCIFGSLVKEITDRFINYLKEHTLENISGE